MLPLAAAGICFQPNGSKNPLYTYLPSGNLQPVSTLWINRLEHSPDKELNISFMGRWRPKTELNVKVNVWLAFIRWTETWIQMIILLHNCWMCFNSCQWVSGGDMSMVCSQLYSVHCLYFVVSSKRGTNCRLHNVAEQKQVSMLRQELWITVSHDSYEFIRQVLNHTLTQWELFFSICHVFTNSKQRFKS